MQTSIRISAWVSSGRDPSLDYRPALGVIPDGMLDSDALGLAAEDGRVLVTNDLRMPKHFAEFIDLRDSPGLLLVASRISIGETIEGLFICWLSWSAEEMQNQIRWLPW
jgi:hypothetical protein